MARKPTGRGKGRPKGSGAFLGEQQTRLTVRIPSALFDRLESYAEGLHFTHDVPQLAGCVRDALEHFLTCPNKRLPKNSVIPSSTIIEQTENSTESDGAIIEQTENGTESDGAIIEQTENGIATLAPRTKFEIEDYILHLNEVEQLGPQAIATRLNEEGVSTFSGKGAWSRGTVSKILARIDAGTPLEKRSVSK